MSDSNTAYKREEWTGKLPEDPCNLTNQQVIDLMLEAHGAGQESGLKSVMEKVNRLKNALKPFVKHYESWMNEYPDDSESSTFSRHTFGEIREAITALEQEP